MNLDAEYIPNCAANDREDTIGSDSEREDNNNSMDLTDITCELLKNHPFVQLEQRPPK